MVKIKTEKDYTIKVIDYKGNLLSAFKLPERKSDFLKAMISLARLYERAKKCNFLTKNLLAAIQTYARTLYNKKDALHLALKYPVILKHIKEIINSKPENLEEGIIYGKIREYEKEVCSLCGADLVYPAYIVFKKDGIEVKKSEAIGIKCLNKISEKLIELAETIANKKPEKLEDKKIENLVERIDINWEKIKNDVKKIEFVQKNHSQENYLVQKKDREFVPKPVVNTNPKFCQLSFF